MSAVTLRASGARQNSDADAGLLEQRMPELLLGLLTVAPSARFTLLLGSEADSGIGLVGLTVDGAPKDSPTLVAEVEAELSRPYTIERVPAGTLSRASAWTVRPEALVQAGFTSTSARSVSDAPFTSGDDEFPLRFRALVSQWLRLAVENPGLLLAMQFAFDPTASAARQFRVSIRVSSDASALPLRARSLVAQLIPGWTIAEVNTDDVVMTCARSTAAGFAQLPIAKEDPLPGLLTSAPRPHPMQPTDRATVEGIRIGAAVLPSGAQVDIVLDEVEQVRHTHIIGNTGTGKSSILAAAAHGFAANGNGFFCADVTGELIPRIIAELPDDALDRVWLIEAGDVHNPVPLNAFAVDDPVELDIIIQDVVLMFYKLFDPGHTGIVGPRFEGLLTNGLRGLRALRGTRASLLDVPRMYRDHRVEAAVAAAVTDPSLIDFWCHEMRDLNSNSRSEITGWFTSKFDRFSNTEAMRRILGSGADAFDPAKAMDEGRIILLDLSKRQLGEVAADMLGFLYITRLWSGFLSRKTNRPFGVIVDEAQSFSAGSLPSMLSEGRKWGASVMIAHQYLGQLDQPLLDALDGNVATKIAFRTGARDASEVLRKIGGNLTVSDVTTQPDLRAIVSRTSGRSSAHPHSLLVDHGDRIVGRTGRQLAKTMTQLRMQTRRDLIEPFRGLEPFDVASLESERVRVAPASTPRPPSHGRIPDPAKQSFLSEWLENHRDLRQGVPADVVGHEDSLDEVDVEEVAS